MPERDRGKPRTPPTSDDSVFFALLFIFELQDEF